MFDRRRAFFAFQGLLTVVVLLFFLYQRRQVDGWTAKFASLSLSLLGSLLFINLAPGRFLVRLWVQAGLFIGDAVLASFTLHWTQEPQSDLYLAYFVIIFGSALTRSLLQSFLVALCASLFYVISAWDAVLGLPREPQFWLRIPFLWTMASLAAILSQDTKQEQKVQEDRYQQRLLQMERVAMLGELSGEVAHQIKGPLTSILVNTDVLLHKHRAHAGRKEIEEIQSEVTRCREILKNLLNWGRLEEVVLQRLELRDAVESALRSVEPRLRRLKVLVEMPASEPAPVLADAALLHEAIAGVLHNAVESMTGGGRLDIRIRPARRRPEGLRENGTEDYIELSVQDSGQGIAPENLQKIFQPFFTTKGSDGSGLGLSATLRIMQNHHGSVEVTSEGPGLGACFRFFIPRAVPGKFVK